MNDGENKDKTIDQISYIILFLFVLFVSFAFYKFVTKVKFLNSQNTVNTIVKDCSIKFVYHNIARFKLCSNDDEYGYYCDETYSAISDDFYSVTLNGELLESNSDTFTNDSYYIPKDYPFDEAYLGHDGFNKFEKSYHIEFNGSFEDLNDPSIIYSYNVISQYHTEDNGTLTKSEIVYKNCIKSKNYAPVVAVTRFGDSLKVLSVNKIK